MFHPYVFCVTMSSPPALDLDALLLRFRRNFPVALTLQQLFLLHHPRLGGLQPGG